MRVSRSGVCGGGGPSEVGGYGRERRRGEGGGWSTTASVGLQLNRIYECINLARQDSWLGFERGFYIVSVDFCN
jgi:hypothetical protein